MYQEQEAEKEKSKEGKISQLCVKMRFFNSYFSGNHLPLTLGITPENC